MSSCGNIKPCPEEFLPGCTVPTYAFGEQEAFGVGGEAALADSQTLQHNEPFILVSGTYYQFNGSFFMYLGMQEYMGFTAHPKVPLSTPFYFTAHKYPGATRSTATGGRSLQSRGTTIREGDVVFITSNASRLALAQYNPPSPFALPQFQVPISDAIENFAQYGTQDGGCIRIVSDDFNESVAPDDQPPIRMDGSKAYYFMLTRIGQYLQVLPGISPAPNVVHTSGFRGAETRLIPLTGQDFYGLVEQEQALREQRAANAAAAIAAGSSATNVTAAETQAAGTVAQNAAAVANNAANTARAANDAAMTAVTNGNAALAVNAAKQANEAAKEATKAAQTAINAANAVSGQSNEANGAANLAVNAAQAAQNLAQNATATAQLVAVNTKTSASVWNIGQ